MAIKVIEVSSLPNAWQNTREGLAYKKRSKGRYTPIKSTNEGATDTDTEALAFKSYLERELEAFRNRH